MLQILQHPPNQRQIEGPKSVWRSCENDPTLKVAVNSEWDVIGLYKAKLAEEMMEGRGSPACSTYGVIGLFDFLHFIYFQFSISMFPR